MSVRWALWGIFSPAQLFPVAVIAGGALLLAGRQRGGRWLIVFGALGLLGFGLLPGADFLARPLEQRFPAADLPADVTGIILLAGSERPGASSAFGQPQTGSHGSRYIAALRLASRYPGAMLVFSGGPMESAGEPELSRPSGVAARILHDIGIAPSRLRFDTSSTDSCAHAGNVRALVRPAPGESWIVVTSAMHMPRVIACFRAAGWPDVLPYPTDYRAVPGRRSVETVQVSRNLEILNVAAHEWIGLVFYRLSGRTREVFPGPIPETAVGSSDGSGSVIDRARRAP